MTYDKRSFLAGIAVGRRLKGWASGGAGALSEIIVRSGPASFIEIPAEGFFGIGKVTVEGDPDLIASNIKYLTINVTSPMVCDGVIYHMCMVVSFKTSI